MSSNRCPSFLSEVPAGAKLLVIRLRSLGDALLMTPALRALKQWRPDLRLAVLLYRRFAPILAGNPDVEEVIELDPKTPLGVVRLAAGLRGRRFAACFNLHGGTLSAALTRLSGAARRVGFRRFRFGGLYTHRVDPASLFGRERLHAAENMIAPFYATGLPQGEIPPLQLFPREEARSAVRQKLGARGVPAGTRYVVVQPVARLLTQEWPFERYGRLARVLEEQHGLVPVLHGGPGEEAKLDAVARAYGKAVVRMEGLSVPELVALVEGAALFVGNDSGPAHIAAALNRPLVVLFGSMDSAAWHPWRAPYALVQNYYPCNPCRGDRCYAFSEPECILSITPEQVQVAVERMLSPLSLAVK